MKNTEIYKWFYSGLGRIWGDTPSWPQSRPALAQFEKPDVIELGVFVSSLAGLATSTLRLALRPNLPATSATSPTVRAPAAPPARAKPIELPTEGAFETSELPACAMRMNFWGAAARLLRPISFHFCRPCSGGVAGRVLGMGCRGIVWGALVGGGGSGDGGSGGGGGGLPMAEVPRACVAQRMASWGAPGRRVATGGSRRARRWPHSPALQRRPRLQRRGGCQAPQSSPPGSGRAAAAD